MVAPMPRKNVRRAAQDQYRWSSIVLGVVTSPSFQMRQASSSQLPAASVERR